ncbi:MAG: MFS transporter [Bryobacteraceae bacterium]
MPNSITARLSFMMFLNFVIWGCWYVTIGTYLTATLKFSGTQTGAIFGTTALASMISPLFVGLIADRFFSSERVLAALHLLGALFLYLVTHTTSFGAVYVLMFVYCLCYFPTLALTTSITLKNVPDARRFPLIRVFGTIGWIAIGLSIGKLGIEASPAPFLIASAASVVMAVFCLFLPHTPPPNKGRAMSVRQILGFDALVMLKDRAYSIFLIASVLACIPLTFYFSFTNAFLNDVGVVNAAGKMTLGQFSEVLVMLAMPFIFKRVSVRGILLLGLVAWSVRYALLAYGNVSDRMWMFYLAIIIHGVCYDFFFMTGQLYTDQEAPASSRNTAQGMYTFVTYGVGMFLGSLLSGGALDFFTSKTRDVLARDWTSFWTSSSTAAFLLFLVFAFLFKSRRMIQKQETEALAEVA